MTKSIGNQLTACLDDGQTSAPSTTLERQARQLSDAETVQAGLEWHREGYVVLTGLFAGEVAALRREIDQCWADPASRLIIDLPHGSQGHQRILLRNAPASARRERHRINDLYLESEAFRKMMLSPGLARVLRLCLHGSPVIINSLHFNFGSENPPHVDIWVMPPTVEGKLVGMSVALEPYEDCNGPLYVYPRSHEIPPYRFSDGSIRSIESEKPAYEEWIRREAADRGIRPTVLLLQPGDVVLWHAHTVHGALKIADPNRTRQSIVVHFWRLGDVGRTEEYRFLHGAEVACGDGYWMRRAHQVPGSDGLRR